MTQIFHYLGGLFLGWSLGANDSANIFGTAVSSKMVRFRLAVCLLAVFVVLGAVCDGRNGILTLSKELRRKNELDTAALPRQKLEAARSKALQVAMTVSYAAALCVTIMTLLKLPVSSSQAVVGAIVGVGILQGNLSSAGLSKIVVCWVGTPIGAALFAFAFYYLLRLLLRKWSPTVFTYDPVMSLLLVVCGCYGAYALGANNVANVSAIFVGDGMLTVGQAALFGGICIAVGALTYSKPVMLSVGKGIAPLNAFSALVCVLAEAVTVHVYAIIGVPVSTSQAIVGAVIAIGLIKGIQTINLKMVAEIFSGWIATPFVAGLLSMLIYYVANLRYIP